MHYRVSPGGQTHVHEYEATTGVADGHIHRAAGVSGMEIPCGVSHVHELAGWTSFEDGHFHPYRLLTGPSIAVSADAHVHYFTGPTAMVDGHVHEIEAATMAAEEERAWGSGVVR